MNANQLINMAVRIVMRKLMHKGINAGIDMASRRRPGQEAADPRQKAEADQAAKRARKAMRVTRRMGRF